MAIKVPPRAQATEKAFTGAIEVDSFTNVTRFVNGAPIEISAEGVSVGVRPEINFIQGTNVTITVTDDAINDRVDVEIAASGSGGSAHTIRDNGSDETQRDALNFLTTTSIIAAAADDAGNNETEVTFERAALTGAIVATQNSNATLFGGILDNGAAENNRTNLNFVPGTFITVAVTDDAGNDELEIGYSLDTNALLSAIVSTSIVINSSTLERAALSGAITAAQNSNVTAFGVLAAKSVLANATNASAVPAALAGSAAFQHLRVNSANTALEWATLSGYASTSITYTSDTFQRAALSGAIAASANANTTLFSGIKVGGSATTDRTNINFIAGTGVSITPTDDAGNDEIELTFSTTGLSGSSHVISLTTPGAQNINLPVGFSSGDYLVVTITNVGDYIIEALLDNAGAVVADKFIVNLCLTNIPDTSSPAPTRLLLRQLASPATGGFRVPGAFNSGSEDIILASEEEAVIVVYTTAVSPNAWRTMSNTAGQPVTGAIAIVGGEGGTRTSKFAGIKDNGSAENDRTNLNFVNSTSITAVVTDDAGNDELEVAYQRAALTGAVTASANSNTTAFGTAAAKSVLTNNTNATAVPAFLAGTAAFQYFRVNSANNATEWSTLSGHASTSITYTSDTFQRAALSGAIVASANTNTTVFAGIRVNGSATTDRTNINFITGSGVTVTATDDAGNDEIEITFTSTAATVTPTTLSIFGTPTNTGVPFIIYVSFAAAAAGTPDDVTVFSASAPFNFRILEAWQVTSTAIASSTVTARTATGGGGSALTTDLSSTVTGKSSDNSTATTTVAASGSVFLRRSDRGVAGEWFAMCVRT